MVAMPTSFAWQVQLPWSPRSRQRRKIATQLDSHSDVGVPVGGIGAGAISRGINGGFTRWTIKAGQVHYVDQPENGFAFWQTGMQARSLRSANGKDDSSWHHDASGSYAALFPKAWHSYHDGPVTLTIEQMTPVSPGLEDDCDLPVGMFRAHLHNTGEVTAEAAVMLSFNNLVGWFDGFNGIGLPGGVAGQSNRVVSQDDLTGVLMEQATAGPLDEGQGQMMVAARVTDDVEITICPAFDMRREGVDLWRKFTHDGRIAAVGGDWVTGGGFSEFPAAHPCAALSVRTELEPGEKHTADFVLVWDLPVIRFGQGRRHLRHYTSRWGSDGHNAERIAAHALAEADNWSSAIDRFHAETSDRLNLPPEATALAINELYFLSDGLSVWTAPGDDTPAHFGVIECPDYPLYNTLDLWVYAASALANTFPRLALLVTRNYAREAPNGDSEMRFHLRSTERFTRQKSGMLPHDLGAPNADPFIRANDYVYQDSSRWKDLNAMFVLCAWRDIRLQPGLATEFHEPITSAMTALAAFDRDGDGLIENDGFPDQTFDNIPMEGVSSYCGGLWLAALRAAAKIAEMAGDTGSARQWQDMSERGEPAFESALWNGSFFRLDTKGAFSEAIFAEQLFGPATARMLDLGDTVDPQKARRALSAIFLNNFVDAGKGRGALAVTSPVHSSSLYAPKGEEGLQWDEILIGFNYSLAAALRTYGMEKECQTLLSALALELGNERGLHFRTPAAIVPGQPQFRAQMNMRPMGIWALADAAAYRNG